MSMALAEAVFQSLELCGKVTVGIACSTEQFELVHVNSIQEIPRTSIRPNHSFISCRDEDRRRLETRRQTSQGEIKS
jgi:hypothetical protein